MLACTVRKEIQVHLQHRKFHIILVLDFVVILLVLVEIPVKYSSIILSSNHFFFFFYLTTTALQVSQFYKEKCSHKLSSGFRTVEGKRQKLLVLKSFHYLLNTDLFSFISALTFEICFMEVLLYTFYFNLGGFWEYKMIGWEFH